MIKKILDDRIDALKKKKRNAIQDARLWESIGVIDVALEFNKRLRFDMFGLYEGRNSGGNFENNQPTSNREN